METTLSILKIKYFVPEQKLFRWGAEKRHKALSSKIAGTI